MVIVRCEVADYRKSKRINLFQIYLGIVMAIL